MATTENTNPKSAPTGTTSSVTVTVIIATYNRAHLIGETLDSLLAQTRAPDVIMVVNDGSTDDTRAVVEGYGERIVYLEKQNGGKSSALNRALDRVEADYVWIFDDDDVALPHALATHLDRLERDSQCDLTYSPHYIFEHSKAGRLDVGQLEYEPMPAIAPDDFFSWMMTSHFLPALMQGMVIAADCLRAAGPFDELLPRSQDRDMVLRIARRARACRIEQPTWALRKHSGQRGSAATSHGAKERYNVWWRYKTRVFGKLRDQLPLAEYLPGAALQSQIPESLKPSQTREALLRRAVVMATHGLLDEASEDFTTYSGAVDRSGEPPNRAELIRVSRIAYIHSGDLVPPPRYYRQLGRAATGQRSILWALDRGLYWSLRRETIRGDPVLAFQCGTRLAALTAYLIQAVVPSLRRKSSMAGNNR